MVEGAILRWRKMNIGAATNHLEEPFATAAACLSRYLEIHLLFQRTDSLFKRRNLLVWRVQYGSVRRSEADLRYLRRRFFSDLMERPTSFTPEEQLVRPRAAHNPDYRDMLRIHQRYGDDLVVDVNCPLSFK
jgi:hypothetical protein